MEKEEESDCSFFLFTSCDIATTKINLLLCSGAGLERRDWMTDWEAVSHNEIHNSFPSEVFVTVLFYCSPMYTGPASQTSIPLSLPLLLLHPLVGDKMPAKHGYTARLETSPCSPMITMMLLWARTTVKGGMRSWRKAILFLTLAMRMWCIQFIQFWKQPTSGVETDGRAKQKHRSLSMICSEVALFLHFKEQEFRKYIKFRSNLQGFGEQFSFSRKFVVGPRVSERESL